MLKHTILFLISLTIAFISSLALAQPSGDAAKTRQTPAGPLQLQPQYSYSNLGSGAGKTTVALGARLLFNPRLAFLDINISHGITDSIEIETKVSSFMMLSLIDFGLKARLLGDETCSFGVRGALTATVLAAATVHEALGGFSLGVMPGATLSFGNETLQVSAFVDVQYYFYSVAASLAMGASDSAQSVWRIRPGVAFEIAVINTTTMYMVAQAYIDFWSSNVSPFLGIGASW